MLKQNIVGDTIANEMLMELSDGEQEASNGGMYYAPPSDTPSYMPEVPSISIGMYGPPSVSCPACSSGQSPHYYGPFRDTSKYAA
ncbi:MAG: hypothetical protein HC852_19530 [Acaryochloridaceae cyanobacterium RU_4_10]|jgi:hypothetical protein|nr:hypothetical protein [Acaryochloridaceae cyanobacterium RU_4_10]